ncbi:MAG: hypothetical protein JZU49_00345 [Sulfuricurvum sp.]|nr:hypothetical protein [Sulfuricurvum sp.]
MQSLNPSARPNSDTSVSKFALKFDGILQRARFTHGLKGEAHQAALIDLSQTCRTIFEDAQSKVAKINADYNFSDTGKGQKKADIINVSQVKVDEWLQASDKSRMVKDLTNRQAKRVEDVRAKFRPENDVVRYMQTNELRAHFQEMQMDYDRLKSISGSVDSKVAPNPVSKTLLEAVAEYDIENVPRARQIEMVLFSLIDSPPWPINYVDDFLRDEITLTLQTKLAPLESKQLNEVKAFGKFINDLGAATRTLIAELR